MNFLLGVSTNSSSWTCSSVHDASSVMKQEFVSASTAEVKILLVFNYNKNAGG